MSSSVHFVVYSNGTILRSGRVPADAVFLQAKAGETVVPIQGVNSFGASYKPDQLRVDGDIIRRFSDNESVMLDADDLLLVEVLAEEGRRLIEQIERVRSIKLEKRKKQILEMKLNKTGG